MFFSFKVRQYEQSFYSNKTKKQVVFPNKISQKYILHVGVMFVKIVWPFYTCNNKSESTVH